MSDSREREQHIRDEIAADEPPELSADDRLLLAAFENEVREFGTTPVQVNVDWGVAWSILGALQLACRHPEFVGQARRTVEGFARYLQTQIALGPTSAAIAEKGWLQPELGRIGFERVEEADPREYGPITKEEPST
jgi:hypothetical protein